MNGGRFCLIDRSVAIGLCQNNFPSNRIPGISEMAGFSVCYNSSGELCNSGELVERLKKYKSGDIVGCGLNSYTGEIFFTLNANFIGSKLLNKAEVELFACVGLNSIASSVALNFGKTPFAFDLEGLIRQTKKQIIEEILDQEIKSEDVNLLILNYLEVYGFNQTLRVFNPQADSSNQHLLHKRDFKTINNTVSSPEETKPQRKFTEDLIGLELSRIESMDFWTPEPNQRKASMYSNSGTDRPARKMSGEFSSDLINKRYSRHFSN